MKISSTSGKGNFIIEKDNNKIVEVQYKNWFSSTAKVKLERQEIKVKPKNIWCSKFDIFKNNQDKGDIIFNRKGSIIIRTINKNNKEVSFLLKAKGFWKQHFELTNQKGELIFVLKPSMNWKKMNYNYAIENISTIHEEKLITELLIYSGFGANLYMTMMMAAVTGGIA